MVVAEVGCFEQSEEYNYASIFDAGLDNIARLLGAKVLARIDFGAEWN